MNMTTRTVIRWIGLVLLLGGILGAIGSLFRPTSDASSLALSTQWVPVHTLFVAANLCIGFGLFGLYLRQADRLGALGFLALVLAVFADMLSVAVAAIQAYVYPGIAAMPDAPKLLSEFISPAGPLPLVSWLNLAFLILYEPGFILLSLLTVRASLLPPFPSWLLLIGSVVSNAVLLGPSWALIGLIGYEAFSLGFAWLGYALWSERSLAKVEVQPEI